MSGSNGTPVLLHLKVSHYNEKVRWALDYKRIAHARRAAVPGRHSRTAVKLTGSRTFPVLVLDGQPIGDSSRIIEAIERAHPEPPLYPADPDERRRALELEDFFDEQLGPHTRLLCVHHMLPDRDLLLGAFFPDAGRATRLAGRAAYGAVRRQFVSNLGVDDAAVATAFDKLRAAGERARAELQPSGYLVGDRFTVADLTLAALLSPLVAPPEFPYPQPQRGHPLLAPAREAVVAAGLLDWAREMYARHRGESAEVPS